MHDVLRFWLERGVDGFRLDAIAKIAKDPLLRDHAGAPRRHDEDWDSIHDRLRGIRRVVDEYPDRMLVGEVVLYDLHRMLSYLKAGDQLHLVHNFLFTSCRGRRRRCAPRSTTSRRWPTEPAWPAWFLANHDLPRTASRFDGDGHGPARARAARAAVRAARHAVRLPGRGARRCPTPRSRLTAWSTSTAATRSARRSRGRRRRAPGRAPASPPASRGSRSWPTPSACASSARRPTRAPRWRWCAGSRPCARARRRCRPAVSDPRRGPDVLAWTREGGGERLLACINVAGARRAAGVAAGRERGAPALERPGPRRGAGRPRAPRVGPGRGDPGGVRARAPARTRGGSRARASSTWLHVVARLGERDVVGDPEALAARRRRAPPLVDLALARVVGGERQHLVAVVVLEQVAQVPRAVGDVDLRRREVALLERGAARLARDVVRGRWASAASGPWRRRARSGRGSATRRR